VLLQDHNVSDNDQVMLPAGYNFGISAATPDSPDSFELFKFILKSSSSTGDQSPRAQQQANQPSTNNENLDDQRAEDRPASDYKTSELQFADLHNRIQFLHHGSNSILREVINLGEKAKSSHQELLQIVVTRDQLANLDSRLQRIEQTLQAIQRDLEGKDYRDRFNQLHETLRSSHLSLAETLQGSIYRSELPTLPPMLLSSLVTLPHELSLCNTHLNTFSGSNNLLDPANGLVHLPCHLLSTPACRVVRRVQAASCKHA
jgi:lectin, mannose-binding 1